VLQWVSFKHCCELTKATLLIHSTEKDHNVKLTLVGLEMQLH
jgi:hypothetical protein